VKFGEAAKNGVDEDDIGIETIDSGGKYEIEAEAVKKVIPSATKPVQQKPGKKLQEMGARDGRDSAPKQGAGVRIAGFGTIRKSEILDALSVEMNFATEITC
jgi:hypothetical protein